MNASALTERLRRHYLPRPDQPGGIFLPECGLNNGYAQQRRCDALHIGFTATTGRVLRGHEIKVARTDWLTELRKVDKASVWADQCHEWWLVTPEPGIVHPGELPTGWGHLVPGPRSRFKVVVAAAPKPEPHQPSWLIVRSIMARLDTLETQQREVFRQEVRAELEAAYARRTAAAPQPSITRAQQVRLEILDRIETDIGVSLSDLYTRRDQFVQAVRIVQAMQPLTRQWSGLATDAQRLRENADNLDTLIALLNQVPA